MKPKDQPTIKVECSAQWQAARVSHFLTMMGILHIYHYPGRSVTVFKEHSKLMNAIKNTWGV